MLKEFYQKALPNEGYFCVAYNVPNSKPFPHDYVTTLDEALDLIDKYKEKGFNVFIAMSTFNIEKREASESRYIKSFYVDLDVGENKEYQSQKEALTALMEFITECKLPVPAIVNSGVGIHAYWFLSQQITREVWKPFAEQLKKLCLTKGLKIDPAITADSARLLRCPNTKNYKQTPPRPTLIIKDAPVYELEKIKGALDHVEISLEDIMKKVPMSSDDKEAKFANFENRFKPLLIESTKGGERGCAQVKHYIDNVKNCPEPIWWRVLSLAQNCADRDEVIHTISKPYSKYDYNETEQKALSTAGKPHTCKDFNEHNPNVCTDCPHWERITTPIQLHRFPIKAPTSDDDEYEVKSVEGEVIEKATKAVHGLPATLEKQGYWVGGKNGGTFRTVTMTDKGGATFKEDLIIYEYTLKVVRHVRSSAEGNCIVVKAWHPHDGMQEFILPMTTVYEKSDLRKALTSEGIYYESTKQEELIMRYFIDYAKDMQKRGKYDVMYDQMGWNLDKSSFVIGTTEITKDGKEKPTPISSIAQAVAPFLTKSGTFEDWKIAAQKLNQHGLEMHMFTLLCGFGSILMDYSSTTGVAISLTGESGAAKTGALYGALSVWGKPKDLSVMNATSNALQGRFLTLHNLPFGFDEVGNKNPYLLSDFILAVSQGKAKLKMQASTNAERDYEAPSSLIAIMTSNHSIYDKLKTIRSNPNGEAARLIEFPVRKPKAFMDDARLGKEIFDEFNSHYGWAGPEFVKAVFKFGKATEIKENLAKWETRFVQDFGNDTAYRFYENLMAVTMTAGEIVNKAGILKIDLDRIYKFIIGEMITIRDEVVKVNDVDYESVLQDYLDANYDKILAFKDEKIFLEPFRQISVRVDHDKDAMFISKKEFDAYLSELPISTKEFVYQMQQQGVDIKAGSGVKQRMNAGWKDVTKSATSVYAIKLSTLGVKLNTPTTNEIAQGN
jgi:hypothetical protein